MAQNMERSAGTGYPQDFWLWSDEPAQAGAQPQQMGTQQAPAQPQGGQGYYRQQPAQGNVQTSAQANVQANAQVNARTNTQPQGGQGKKDDEYSSPETMLKGGAILQAYGRSDMLSVYPIPNIHMVRWSIVKLGTSGKDHMDFYMKMDDMRRLCAEILDGTAEKRIRADQGKYPSAYRFVGGRDGSREVNIGKGQKGILVQVRCKDDGGSWGYKMIAVNFSALRDMAFYFNLIMGLTPASRYYGHLADVYWMGEARRENEAKEYRAQKRSA